MEIKKIQFIIIYILIIVTTQSCSTRKLFVMNSKQKKVKIEAYDFELNKFILLGYTPYKENEFDMHRNLFSKDIVHLKLSKPGHYGENFVLNFEGQSNIKINSYLVKSKINKKKDQLKNNDIAKNIITLTQRINNLVKKNKLNIALRETNNLIKKYPAVSILFDMQGSIHYLLGQRSRSIVSYKKSLTINPENLQTRKMMIHLNEMRDK
jgi:tetratricopeptide (TPR) repeat protein